MAENHKLWGGRFEASLEKWVEEFGASISFDQKMAEFDLKGSIAHVTMLGETGIITKVLRKLSSFSITSTNLAFRYKCISVATWSLRERAV